MADVKTEKKFASLETAKKINDDVASLKEDLGDYVLDVIESKYTQAQFYNDNYWQILNASNQLVANNKYIVKIKPNDSFKLDTLQVGPSSTGSDMVDTLAKNVSFTKGVVLEIKYTPSVSGLRFIRVLSSASKISSIEIYVSTKKNKMKRLIDENTERINDVKEDIKEKIDETNGSIKSLECLKTFAYQSDKINSSLKDMRLLKNSVDETMSSLMIVRTEEGIEKTITVHGTKTKILPISLHYGAKKYTQTDRDIFFDGQCNTDFSDVRFFDANGKMLNAILGKAVNMDLLPDTSLDTVVKVTSNGYLVNFTDLKGITISKDNGRTFESLEYSKKFTEHASDVYGYKSLKPIYVDDYNNIFAYAGGKLYKLYANDNYINYREVLDFTWVDSDGTVHYPDIQNHGMDKSRNGVLFVGACYTEKYHTSIFKSTDGGESFDLTWHDWSGSNYQHVHHIHADKYSNKVYVGIDDGAITWNGSHIIVTSDDGVTWNEISTERNVRGRDYYPTYFGNGYKLGGGETYLMGSATIYRSTDDVNFDMPVLGLAGVRSFSDFGDDSLIVCGSQINSYCAENHIFISKDRGVTWDSVYTMYQEYRRHSGAGYRDIQPVATLAGDTEPCIIASKDDGKVPSVRIYRGGNHYYRQAFLLLDEATDDDITIVAKTGYMIPYTQKKPYGIEHEGLVYAIDLSEGYGYYIKDSRGIISKIEGDDFIWSKMESSRYGDHTGKSTYENYYPYSGLKLNNKTMIKFPACNQLNFDKGYTVSLWVNMDAVGLSYNSADYWKISNIRHLLTVGGASFMMHGTTDIGVFDSTQKNTQINYADGTLKRIGKRHYSASGMLFSKCQFFNIVIVVDENKKCHVYNNGCEYEIEWNNLDSAGWGNLSNGDIVLGNLWGIENCGYISNVKIFNRPMSKTEVLEMYRGM